MDRRLSVAPMMGQTDSFMRNFLRQFSALPILFTEMIPVQAIIYGERDKILSFDAIQHPLILQLGGRDPDHLVQAVRHSRPFGYDEINLNVGCPSARVKEGAFGACLFKDAPHVARCIEAMGQETEKPISIKTRIGVDECDHYHHLHEFIATTSEAGCRVFYIHARKAWLKGLSPKENRSIPPLEYQKVMRLKQDFPDLTIILNGGIQSIDTACDHLEYCDGVMIGRAACKNPWILTHITQVLQKDKQEKSLYGMTRMLLEKLLSQKVKASSRLPAWSGLFYGRKGAKEWRCLLADWKQNSYQSNKERAGRFLRRLEEDGHFKTYEARAI